MLNNAEIRYLGSCKELNAKACLDNKLKTLVEDEFGLSRPLSVSLVVPTKIDVTKETRDVELNVMRLVMSECSKLVDLGYLDEIIVIDGSLDEKGDADFNVLERVVETAYDELDLFKRQVRLINENKAQALMARRGFFDFIVKTVHQSDPNIFYVLKKSGLNDTIGLPRIPMGKGAALWLSIPLTAGDVVCFTDSDIMNFTKEFVMALCHPIISGWHDPAPRIKMIKACYKRLTVSFEPLGRRRFFGGRVTRLFAIPILRVLSKEYPNIFSGLNSLNYPLSGECAMRRELLQEISFPNDYSIEIAILRQVVKLAGFTQMAQVDLNFFHHIGQSTVGLKRMVAQIISYIVEILEEEGVEFSKPVRKRILMEYKNEVEKLLIEYEEIFNELSKSIAQDLEVKPSYSKNKDIETFRGFLELLGKALTGTSRKERFVLPSWAELGEKASYFLVSTLLRRRGNQSTFSRLKDTGLFYGL